jgi:hypothetical protein
MGEGTTVVALIVMGAALGILALIALVAVALHWMGDPDARGMFLAAGLIACILAAAAVTGMWP